jgi:hypothetical protein
MGVLVPEPLSISWRTASFAQRNDFAFDIFRRFVGTLMKLRISEIRYSRTLKISRGFARVYFPRRRAASTAPSDISPVIKNTLVMI